MPGIMHFIHFYTFTRQTREVRRVCFQNQGLHPKSGFFVLGTQNEAGSAMIHPNQHLRLPTDTEGFNPVFFFTVCHV